MIVSVAMMSAGRAAEGAPLWFRAMLVVVILAFIVWGLFALAALERDK